MNKTKRWVKPAMRVTVLTVIILGAVAVAAFVPMYGCDYTPRAHVAEGLALAAGLKNAVTEFRLKNGYWPSSNAMVGVNDKFQISGNAVRSVSIEAPKNAKDSAIIVIAYNEKLNNGTLRLKPTINASGTTVTWRCVAESNLDPAFLPSNCKERTE